MRERERETLKGTKLRDIKLGMNKVENWEYGRRVKERDKEQEWERKAMRKWKQREKQKETGKEKGEKKAETRQKKKRTDMLWGNEKKDGINIDGQTKLGREISSDYADKQGKI